MHNLINQSSTLLVAAHPDIDHTKNPFSKLLLLLNQSYFQPNQHHPAIPVNRARHQTPPVSLCTFLYLHLAHLAIRHRVKVITAILIVVVVVIFPFHMHQVEVRRLDTYLKIRRRLLEASVVMQDSVEDIQQVNMNKAKGNNRKIIMIIFKVLSTRDTIQDSEKVYSDRRPAMI